MWKARFSEEQIAYALRQVEQGTPATELCRKLGISEQTFYTWKKRFAGMGVSELKRVRQLEEENRRLKSVVADLTLDKHVVVCQNSIQRLRSSRMPRCDRRSWSCQTGAGDARNRERLQARPWYQRPSLRRRRRR